MRLLYRGSLTLPELGRVRYGVNVTARTVVSIPLRNDAVFTFLKK